MIRPIISLISKAGGGVKKGSDVAEMISRPGVVFDFEEEGEIQNF